jgi:triacylglycerol lipase
MATPPPANLNCILLNACGAAYNIAPGTCTYTADTIYSPNVPYAQDPQTACGGEGLINAATVGQCPFGIVVAFRGTLPPSLNDPDSWLDWLQNFFAVPMSNPTGPNRVPGQVHSGFFNATTSILHQVQTLVTACNPGPDNPVFVTGHSKGGALASIGGYILSQDLNVPNVQPLFTFASAKPGDAAFRDGFQQVLSQTRYENFDDIVPLLPPSLDFIQRMEAEPGLRAMQLTSTGRRLAQLLESAKDWNYVPVGTMLFITSSFQVISNETVEQQTLDVVEEFVKDILQRNFSSFGRAHSLLPASRMPGTGYNTGVCGK